MSRLSLLVSARDPAAALQLAAFCSAARDAPMLAVTVVAQPPAAGILRARGLAVREVALPCARARGGAEATALLDAADAILAESSPDVLLCGLSSPSEGGIDEALLARRRVPAFVVQDFWGEMNDFFGRGPDALFVLDEVAVELSRRRHGTAAIMTGSPRHGEYQEIDAIAARRSIHQRHGISATARVIGLFGQHLHAKPGYRRTLEGWAGALRGLPGDTRIAYRPHPRELPQERAWMREWFRSIGVPVVVLEQCSTEEALAACHAACTVFSNCAYDAAYLNYFSAGPLVTPVMLLFDEEMVSFYSSIANFSELPYFSRNLVLSVREASALAPALLDATLGDAGSRVWRAARDALPDPVGAVERMIAVLVAAAQGEVPSSTAHR